MPEGVGGGDVTDARLFDSLDGRDFRAEGSGPLPVEDALGPLRETMTTCEAVTQGLAPLRAPGLPTAVGVSPAV